MLGALPVAGRVLLVTQGMDEPTTLSIRNLPDVRPVLADRLCALDVLSCDALIATRDAVAALEGRLS